MVNEIRSFSLREYVDAALALAEYTRDENGVVIADVASLSGYFAQGDTFEEARSHLRDVIEGNVMLALQLGLTIQPIDGVTIGVQRA